MKYIFVNFNICTTYKPAWLLLLFEMVFLCVCGYYLEDFHFLFPYHTLLPSFRELPSDKYNFVFQRLDLTISGIRNTRIG